MDVHLQHNIAVDIPTGQTPMKRAWPEALSTGEDPLDQERQTILDHLKKPSLLNNLSSVKDYSDQIELSDKLSEAVLSGSKNVGPRISSALAARKASRRSSVLTAANPLIVSMNVKRI